MIDRVRVKREHMLNIITRRDDSTALARIEGRSWYLEDAYGALAREDQRALAVWRRFSPAPATLARSRLLSCTRAEVVGPDARRVNGPALLDALAVRAAQRGATVHAVGAGKVLVVGGDDDDALAEIDAWEPPEHCSVWSGDAFEIRDETHLAEETDLAPDG